MMSFRWLIFLRLVARYLMVDGVDYCNITSCPIVSKHVMCLHPEEGEGKMCLFASYKKLPLTFEDEEDILKSHNLLRNAVASGNELDDPPFGMGLPSAEDMFLVRWESELAALARRTLDQCQDWEMHKGECSNTEKFSNVVQIMFTEDCADPQSVYSTIYDAMINYLKAINRGTVALNFRPYEVESMKKLSSALPTMLWYNLTHVGCARGNRKPHGDVLICNYGINGKVDGTLYKKGYSCQSCKCSEQYTSLCLGKAPATRASILSPIVAILVLLCPY